MGSIMGVQRTATKRNQRAELVSLFIFSRLAQELALPDQPRTQERSLTPISDDTWDTFLYDAKADVYVWSQTTCYKGYGPNVKAEANKTYEFRETVTELISLLATSSNVERMRTVHILFGNKNYAYPWMADFKALVFDKSITIDLVDGDIHQCIENAIGQERIEANAFKRLDAEIFGGTQLGNILKSAINELSDWAHAGYPTQELARDLSRHVRSQVPKGVTRSDSQVVHSIKKRVISTIVDPSTREVDPGIISAAESFLDSKPFIRASQNYLRNWEKIKSNLASDPTDDLVAFISKAWTSQDEDFRIIIRRLFLRATYVGDVNYVQDLDVAGVTEHNLYNGVHNDTQVAEISTLIASRLRRISVTSPSELRQIIWETGQATLRALVDYEVQNGTTANYSTQVVKDIMVEASYRVEPKPDKIGYPARGYHVDLMEQRTVRGPDRQVPGMFNNLSLVLTNDNKPLAYIKTKYFRNQEYERRAKEESFIGLMMSFDHAVATGSRRLPLIMYVDTDTSNILEKVQRALNKLESFGWIVCQTPQELKDTLRSLESLK